MGSRRVGLARTQALIEGLKRELNLGGSGLNEIDGLAGQVAATVTAAGTAAALSEAFICPVDSANNSHKVKMFNATYAGQIVIIINIDSGQDAIVRDGADSATLATLGEGKGCILVSSATGDNWIPVAVAN